MESEKRTIQILNCKCIKKADVEIEERTLNIKYDYVHGGSLIALD